MKDKICYKCGTNKNIVGTIFGREEMIHLCLECERRVIELW